VKSGQALRELVRLATENPDHGFWLVWDRDGWGVVDDLAGFEEDPILFLSIPATQAHEISARRQIALAEL